MSKSEDKRKQILKAGEEMFSQGRFDEVTMDAVASKAHVGKGTLYRYFSGKEELLLAVFQAGHDDLVATMREYSEREGDFLEILREACHQIAVSHERRHPVFHMIFTMQRRRDSAGAKGADCTRMKQNFEEILSALTAVLQRGVSCGKLRTDVPVAAQAAFLLNLLHGWARMSHQNATIGNVSLDTMVDLFCQGVLK